MTVWHDGDQGDEEVEDQVDGRTAFVRPDDTGLERVDAVLARVTTVTDLPLEEQVQVFEAVHVELRAALDSPGA